LEEDGVHGAALDVVVDFDDLIELLNFVGVVKMSQVPLDTLVNFVVAEVVSGG